MPTANARNADAQDDGPQIRTTLYDRDAKTKAQTMLDIHECSIPARTGAGSWTALAKDADAVKRALILDLSNQIDRLIAGEVDEIRICVAP